MKNHSDEHDDLREAFGQVKSHIDTLEHINNLSDKQKPVFDKLVAASKAFDKEFKSHIHSTSWVSPVQFAFKAVMWISGIGGFIALLNAIGMFN